jgi:molybdopterin-containing oxidoreductase family membrane subunit
MWTFFVALVINIGMWFERFNIIVVDLSKGRTPSGWAMFQPTFVDIGIFMGTIGFFFVLFLLYARTFPVIAQAEVKTILKSSGERYKRLREEGKSLEGAAIDKRTSQVDSFDTIEHEKHSGEVMLLLENLGEFDPTTQKKDHLQEINGIGPKTELHLNDIGIYSYQQISKMTKIEYDLFDSISGSFPGRAESDDWAGQAKKLINK